MVHTKKVVHKKVVHKKVATMSGDTRPGVEAGDQMEALMCAPSCAAPRAGDASPLCAQRELRVEALCPVTWTLQQGFVKKTIEELLC